MPQMPAITISQPWATKIADGQKWVENRNWRTTYTGPLAIHAGSGTQYLRPRQLRNYETGKVLAVAELVGCVGLQEAADAIRLGRWRSHPLAGWLKKVLNHEYTEGPYCWILRDVRKLAVPVKCPGQLGLWDWTYQEETISA